LFPESSFQDFNYPIMLNLLIRAFHGYYLGVGLLLIYRIWFIEINNFIAQSILFLRTYYKEIITIGALIPLIFGFLQFPTTANDLFSYLIPSFALLAGYLIGVAVWYFPKHPYSRRVNTILSSVLIFWSLVLVLNHLGLQTNISIFPSNLALLVPGTLLIFCLGVDTYLWQKEVIQFLYETARAIKLFIKTYYRELVTVVSLGLMIAGFWNWTSMGEPPTILFFLAYLATMIIWYLPDRHEYFRGIATTLSVVVLIWGLAAGDWTVDFSNIVTILPLFASIVYIGTGSVLPAYLWREELLLLVKQIAQVIAYAFQKTIQAFIEVVRGIWNAIKRGFWDVIELGRAYFRALVKTVATLLGVLLEFIGLIYIDIQETAVPSIFMMLIGTIVLYITWRNEINDFLGRTVHMIRNAFTTAGLFLWYTGVAIKQAIVDFLQYLWSIRIAILRAVMTITGPILMLFALSFAPLPYDITFLDVPLRIMLFIFGLILLYGAWFAQINEFLVHTARSIRKAFITLCRYIWSTIIAIKDAIIAFFSYIGSRWREIIRAIATVLGAFLVIIGFSFLSFAQSDGERLVNIGLIILGLAILYISWRSQIKALIARSVKTLQNTFKQLTKALSELLARTWTQMSQIVRNGIDSSVYLAIVTLGFSAIGYGLILFITILTDDQGAWTKEIIKPIPIIGEILWIIAAFLQGKAVDDVANLIGIFANEEPYILFFLSVIFLGFGISIPIVFFFLRDSIKISSLRLRFGGSKEKEVRDDD
ncbi:MAG: hypothetical protein ACTSPV_17935, partial [Candidatus Hodarchaeales archaeon]